MSEFKGLKDFSKQFRDVLLKYTLPTPPDIVTGLATIVPNNYASYLSDIGADPGIREMVNVNPGSVDDDVIYQKSNLNKNIGTPDDIKKGIEDLTQSQAAAINYLAGIQQPTLINDLANVNQGSVDGHSIYREQILKQNENLIPEIEAGLKDLSETQMTTKQYTDNLDKEVLITDRAVIDPGSVDDHNVYREKNMIKNQQVQSDVVAGLRDISASQSAVAGYIDSIDKPGVISDLVVTNPGDVVFFGDQQRTTDFSRNKKIDPTDVSEGGDANVASSITQTTYNNWIHDIGVEAKIGDYAVVNHIDLDSSSVTDTTSGIVIDKNLIDAFNLNTYVPNNGFQIFDETIIALKRDLSDTGAGFWTEDKISFVAQQYDPIDFLQGVGTFDIGGVEVDLNQIASDAIMNTAFIGDGILGLLGKDSILKGESMMMNLGALFLRYNFNERIKAAVIRETILKTRLDEAATNPLAALDLIKHPSSLIEKNYQISVSANPIGAAGDLFARIAGTISPTEFFGLGDFLRDSTFKETLVPGRFPLTETEKKVGWFKGFVNDVTGKSLRENDRDAWLLNRTSDGQKAQLFQNIAFNRYRPDYTPHYNSGVANALYSTINFINGITGFLGLSEGSRPVGNYYLGDKTKNNPNNLLQQKEGFYQTGEIEKLSTTFENPNDYIGRDFIKIGEYGILSSDFVWMGKDNFLRVTSGNTDSFDNNYNTALSYGVSSAFREGTLIDITQKIIDTDTKAGQAIDQINKSFSDGFKKISRGSNVYKFKDVIDSTGRRNYEAMTMKDSKTHEYKNGELCRVWTKDKPYGKITTAMKYSELIRLERNSVMDRYGNLNIFPSKLNVNKGYGDPRFVTSDGRPAVTEYYGELRARKYMFSIENLAWRDTALERTLPPCEKGPNGGRIMWFPPYGIQVTDNNTANWTSTVFLGRPEPVYTYNNTERTGTLNFKVVVDHPSILNLLVRYELKKESLESSEIVDRVLEAFWSGCIKYDVFDLARMWGVFSVDELTQLKVYLETLNGTDPYGANGKTVNKPIYKPGSEKKPEPVGKDPIKEFTASFLYFRNDYPKPTDPKTGKDDLKLIKSYDEYFKEYKAALSNANPDKSVTYVAIKSGKKKDRTFKEHYDLGLQFASSIVKSKISNGLDTIVVNWKNLLDTNKGANIKAAFSTYTSPIATSEYNKKLAIRRFVSIAKLLINKTKEFRTNIYLDDKGTAGSTDLNKYFNSDFTTATFYILNPDDNKTYSEIILTNTLSSEITVGETAGSTGYRLYDSADPMFGEYLDKYTTPDYPFYYTEYKLPTKNKVIEIRILNTDGQKADSSSDVTLKNYYDYLKKNNPNDTIISPDDDFTDYYDVVDKEGGRTIALASITGHYNKYLTSQSYVASVLSEISCLSRYGYFYDVTVKKPEKVTEPEIIPGTTEPGGLSPWKVYTPGTDPDYHLTFEKITKRDIAQRILNKLVTECDYFDYLDKDYPGVFNTLKEKLKYFSPGFHSTTPEGLNSRLTFLQQCLRPGQTIVGNNACDANNTAFGKPPVCVLRIGDFYHSKIIIDSINFSYDELVFDMNPEGIGVQPMIADVNMSFKFIGGQGLRKAVEQLQNALSFNYFANADVYDDRTFANTDEYERSLINLETSFFDQDQLDIARIVENASKIKDLEKTDEKTNGTVGVPLTGTNKVTQQTPIDEYIAGNTYNPGDYVFFGVADDEYNTPIVWKCIIAIDYNDDNMGDDDPTPMEDSAYWENLGTYNPVLVDDNTADSYEPYLIPVKGLYPLQIEYGNSHIQYYKLNYWDAFNDLYNSLDRLVGRRINKYNDITKILTDAQGDDKTLILNNPMLTAGILMNSFSGISVKNALYGGESSDRDVLNMLSLPDNLSVSGSAISSFAFNTASSKTGVISDLISITAGTASGSTITIGKANKGLYNKYLHGTDITTTQFYNKFTFADDEYYKLGIDGNILKGSKDSTDIQLLMLHLYPQGGHYRMPEQSSFLSGGTSSQTFDDKGTYAKLSYLSDNIFRPRYFGEFFIPNPLKYNPNNVITSLNVFKTGAEELISNLNLTAFRRNIVKGTANDDVKLQNTLNKLETGLKDILTYGLIENFNNNLELLLTYYDNYVNTSDGNFSDDLSAFDVAVHRFADLAMVLNGVDAGIEDNKIVYYDVMPNAVTYSGEITIGTDSIKRGAWENHFKYNPYVELPVNGIILVKSDLKEKEFSLGSTSIKYNLKTLSNVTKGYTVAENLDYGTQITNEKNTLVYYLDNTSLKNYETMTINALSGVTDAYTKYLLRTPIDYSIHQLTTYNYGADSISGITRGKTYHYGLPYRTSGGTISSGGTIIDYIGNGTFDDYLSTTCKLMSSKELEILPNEYKSESGRIVKYAGANGDFYFHANGLVSCSGLTSGSTFSNCNETTSSTADAEKYKNYNKPNMTTVFERMNHEMVYLMQKYDQALMLDTSRQLMDINTIYSKNVLIENSAVTEIKSFYNEVDGSDDKFNNITNSNSFYDTIKLRPNSAVPVTNISIDVNNKDAQMFFNIANFLSYSKYLTKKELDILYLHGAYATYKSYEESRIEQYLSGITQSIGNEVNADKRFGIKNITTFEEIMLANLIYSGAEKVVMSLSDDIKILVNDNEKEIKKLAKKRDTSSKERHDALIKINKVYDEINKEFIGVVATNIQKILSKLTDEYKVANGLYGELTTAKNKAYTEIKPKILTDKTSYNLKLKKAVETNIINKALYAQHKPGSNNIYH